MKLTLGKYTLDLSEKTHIMGILNVTPDSFSDGGLYLEPKKAIEQSFKMKEEGADIIDIGGQSTRPGSTPVSEKEELKRILPVLKALMGRIKLPISIDT
ncbi:MAG: dihydropteroate synthase, partial [bacterium]